MARKPAPDTRDRILDTAADLFDRYGVHAVGMQQIIDAVGCGKTLLYREFASKDALVVAYLERSTRGWDNTLAAARAAADDPADQLVELVRILQGQVPGTRGCSLRNTYAEFPDPDHPAHQVALEHYGVVRAQLRELARETKAVDPDRLGDRVMLIIDGIYTNASVLGAAGAAMAAVDFAKDVIRAETV